MSIPCRVPLVVNWGADTCEYTSYDSYYADLMLRRKCEGAALPSLRSALRKLESVLRTQDSTGTSYRAWLYGVDGAQYYSLLHSMEAVASGATVVARADRLSMNDMVSAKGKTTQVPPFAPKVDSVVPSAVQALGGAHRRSLATPHTELRQDARKGILMDSARNCGLLDSKSIPKKTRRGGKARKRKEALRAAHVAAAATCRSIEGALKK